MRKAEAERVKLEKGESDWLTDTMERVKREKNGQHEETFEKIKMFSQFLRNLKDDTLIAHRSAIAHPSALLVLLHVSLLFQTRL